MIEGWYVLVIFTTALAILSAVVSGLGISILFSGPFRSLPFRLSSRSWFFFGSLPIVVGASTGIAGFSSAVLKKWTLISDHCEIHPGHPHLCWTHAQADLLQASILGSVGLLGCAFFVSCLLRLIHSVWGSDRELQSTRISSLIDGFTVLPSQVPAAIVAGVVRPRAYLTTAAAELLSPRERWIVSRHEDEHLRGRDPLCLFVLRLGSALFPGLRKIEQSWLASRELECDAACLAAGASPEEVSQTILKLARLSGSRFSALSLSYVPDTSELLRHRVETLLSSTNPLRSRARGKSVWCLLLTLALVLLLSGHHGLETVLGVVIN